MRVLALFLFVAITLFGCSGKPATVVWNDGQEAYFTKCKGAMEKCLKVAGKTCPAGYQPLKEAEAGKGIGWASIQNRYEFYWRCKSAPAGASKARTSASEVQ